MTNLKQDAEPVRLLAPLAGKARHEIRERSGRRAAAPRLNGRGLAAADVGNDGRMAIAVNTIGGRLVLLRSTGPVGHWLEVRLSRFITGSHRHRRPS